MICPNCEHQNPESNRFCGMCGSQLVPAEPEQHLAQESVPGENGGAGRRPFIVSTTAMADVTAQMLNSRVVLPSPTLASTHSGYVSSLKPQAEPVYHDQILRQPEPAPERPQHQMNSDEEHVHTVRDVDSDSGEDVEAERWLDRTAAEHESRMPPTVSSTPSSGSILGLSAPIGEVSSKVEQEEREPDAVRDRDSFLYIDDPNESHANDVSGPSFLGLGSNDVAYEEEQPSGHGRRYLLLAMLAIVVVLGVLEWRASQNGESTNPMDVLHLKLPKKKGQGPAQVVPQSSNPNTASAPSAPPDVLDNTPAGSAATNSAPQSTTAGKPDLIAEPAQPAAAKPTAVNTSPNASKAQSQNPPQENASSVPTTNAAPTPTSPADTTAKSAAIAEATPPPATRKAAPLEPANMTKPSPRRSTPAASIPEPEADASLNAGNAELQKGVAAGSTELGRMWLWKATAKGNGEAPVLLADMYAQGKGMPKDCEQAMLLLNAAAKKMNVRARSKLGSMYAAGECVPQDRVKAYKWMSAALEANPGSEWLEKNRATLLQQMSPAERQRASR